MLLCKQSCVSSQGVGGNQGRAVRFMSGAVVAHSPFDCHQSVGSFKCHVSILYTYKHIIQKLLWTSLV